MEIVDPTGTTTYTTIDSAGTFSLVSGICDFLININKPEVLYD